MNRLSTHIAKDHARPTRNMSPTLVPKRPAARSPVPKPDAK